MRAVTRKAATALIEISQAGGIFVVADKEHCIAPPAIAGATKLIQARRRFRQASRDQR
jgi:hypothetical protein